MFKNYLKTAVRSFLRQKIYVFINMIGLAVGIASSLLIFLFVNHHLNYDTFHQKGDQIYRLILDGKIGGQELLSAYTATPIAPTMQQDYPEVEAYCRVNVWGRSVVRIDDRHFEEKIMGVDSTFFQMFSFPLMEGEVASALAAPHQVVLSQSTAKRIFGQTSAMGQMIFVGSYDEPFKVTGVFQDLPENSHLEADVMISFMTNHRADHSNWLSNSFNTYVQLAADTDPRTLESKLPEMITKHVGPELQEYLGISIQDFMNQGNRYGLYLQALADIHRNPSIEQDTKPAIDPKYLIVFSAIALLIIIIAAINYMNLSTARAAKRAKEVGIRKVSGSTRNMLIAQFLVESVVLSVLSLFIAILIIELVLPYFNTLLDGHFYIPYFAEWYVLPALVGLVVAIGMLAGSYPAFFLSSFKPVKVLHSSVKNSMKNGRLRSALVVLQFSISLILIIGTLVMFRQIHYMLHKDLGYDDEQLLVVERAHVIGDQVEAFKDQLKALPGVANVTGSTAVPFRTNNNNGYKIEGRQDESFLMASNWVDYDFFDTYGIALKQGRNFSTSFGSDQKAVLINQSATKEFSLTEPLSTRFIDGMDSTGKPIYLQVIGVSSDFNFESLHRGIGPYIFKFKTEDDNWGYFTLKLTMEDLPETLKQIKKVWAEFSNNTPMQYFFFNDEFAQQYKEEQQNARLAILFTILAIVIASLGLFGLTSFTTEQRTKEIGVRKAMGSSSLQVVLLLSREITLLVLISTIIACPVAWYVLSNWLNNFYYSISLSPLYFGLAFIIGLGIALLTVSFQAIKAAHTNPATALRYE